MQPHWLTRPATVRRLWWLFAAVLAATVFAQFFVAADAHFPVERWFGFNAAYGFVACAAMVIGAKAIGWLLKRPDDYYERGDGGRRG